jgi:hypothetical protein
VVRLKALLQLLLLLPPLPLQHLPTLLLLLLLLPLPLIRRDLPLLRPPRQLHRRL